MQEYTFVTYNIFKAHLPFAKQNIGSLCARHDFVAIQEWVSTLHLKEKNHITSCPTFTLPLRNIQTGTATVSAHPPKEVLRILSKQRELGFLTPKSMLITEHTLHSGDTLHIANIHSLNFVPNFLWKRHIDHFVEQLPKSGPLIFAGDFNTWNPWRFDYLEKILHSKKIHYANYDHNIIMRLDHIFIRDITVIETKEDSNMHTSDHYPIILRFKLS